MFAGQRAKDQLGDMFVYHIETGAIEVLSEANSKRCYSNLLLDRTNFFGYILNCLCIL